MDTEAREPCSSKNNPEECVNTLQQGTAIHGAIERLTPVRRHLLTLAFFEDLSRREIPTKTQMAPGMVKSHLCRALLSLRVDLQGQ